MRELMISGFTLGAIPVTLMLLFAIVCNVNFWKLQRASVSLLEQVRATSPDVYRAATKSRFRYRRLHDKEGFRQFLEGERLDDVPSIAQQKKITLRLLRNQQRMTQFLFLLFALAFLTFAISVTYPYIKGLMYVLEKQ